MDIGVRLEDLHGIIPAAVLEVDDLIGGQSEDEGVLPAYLLHDLHVGAVHGSQSQCTV